MNSGFLGVSGGWLLALAVIVGLLDHFGWLGNDRVVASPTRLVGAGLLIAGLILIVYAKNSETPPIKATSSSSADTGE